MTFPLLEYDAAAVAAIVAVHHVGPAATSITPLRRTLWPRLAGVGDPGHVALTFDDGPDPAYTPELLEILARSGTKATFFFLGSMLSRHDDLGRDVAAAGHEVALHGWDHHNVLTYGFRRALDDLTRGRDLIEDVTGVAVRWWRPPYGVLAAPAIVAARQLDLTPVLWTAWGRDWTRHATGPSVVATVERGLRPGGTVLLHDSDCTSAPGSSRATMAAVPVLIDRARARGWLPGTLAEHGIAREARQR